MLDKNDFVFFYLIVCSRGPGSETITVNNVTAERDAIEFDESAEAELKEYGVCSPYADFNDEGHIIAVPKCTKPLKAIYAWLRDHTGDENVFFDYREAYLSACLRAFLPSQFGTDLDSPWTSVNGWRSVEIEIPNKAQFEAFIEATGETIEQLATWDCAVLKETARRYMEGTLAVTEFPGC